MPHGACYLWRSDVLWVHAISDAVIGFSYYSIPLVLLYFARNRRHFSFPRTLYLFGAFIFACGTTHLFAILTLWRPYYPLEGAIKLVTAIVSLATAIALVRVVPEALNAPDATVLHWVNVALHGELIHRAESEQRILQANSELDRRVRERTAELEQSLRDKEALLREVHHRVKNNLQIVSGLLSMQADQIGSENALETFRAGQSRVQAIAFLHEALYDSGVQERVNLSDYLPRVLSNLAEMYSSVRNRFAPTVRLDRESLGLKEAVPLGLILNELVSNAMKHAYPDGAGGPIDVEVISLPSGRSRLTVRDYGVGTPESVAAATKDSLGMRMVEGLVRQLTGTFHMERNGESGLCCIVEFPARDSGEQA